MNLANWLVRSARRTPEAPALFRGTELEADYREFARRAAAIGAALAVDHAIAPGDRVAIFAANSTQYLEALYGVWFAGAVAVPVNAKLHEREAAWIIANAGAKCVFADAKSAPGLARSLAGSPDEEWAILRLDGPDFTQMYAASPLEKPVERLGDDMAWLFYTSGTTGKPKGVEITCANLQAMAHAYLADVDRVEADDTAFYAAPISHGAGIYNIQHVLKGARHAVPVSGGFDPQEILDAAGKLGNLHMFAAPTMVRRLVAHCRETGSGGEGIRSIVYGGGPMYVADIVEAVEVMGPRFIQIYGQGECPMAITVLPREMVADRSHPRWRERLASVGMAQSCVEVRIAGPDGRELPPDQTGEVLVRGTPVMSGYWNNPQATASALRDGWLWTGDMGSLDGDGFLTLRDRSKDVIISGGTNVYPREVEEALLEHPAVAEVSVVGRPDPEWGETVFAFIRLEAGASAGEEELDAHCLDRIARFKRPKAYRFVSDLPKNNYGKILKTELRQLLEKGE